jgi:hypothetical protein
MQRIKVLDLGSFAAKTATFSTGPIPVPEDATGVVASIVVTAASGTTPTLAASIRHLMPQDTSKSASLITGANLTAAGNSQRIGVVPDCAAQANIMANDVIAQFIDLNFAIAGTTPSFTFSVVLSFFK